MLHGISVSDIKNPQERIPSTSNSTDLETGADLSGKPPLRSAQDNVEEFLAGGHRLYLLPGRLHVESEDRSVSKGG